MSQFYMVFRDSDGVCMFTSTQEPADIAAGYSVVVYDFGSTAFPDEFYKPGGTGPVTRKANPVVTSLTVTSGSHLGGTSTIINGANFLGATSVTFGGTAASFDIIGSGGVIEVASTPAHAAGVVDVVVTTGYGSGTKVGGFTYT